MKMFMGETSCTEFSCLCCFYYGRHFVDLHHWLLSLMFLECNWSPFTTKTYPKKLHIQTPLKNIAITRAHEAMWECFFFLFLFHLVYILMIFKHHSASHSLFYSLTSLILCNNKINFALFGQVRLLHINI